MEIFSFYNAIFSVLFGMKQSLSLTDVLLAGGGALLVWLPLFILQGIGLFTMAKKRRMKGKWMAFIPFLNVLFIGRLTGDCFVFAHKMKRGGLCVMIAQIITVVVMLAYVAANAILFVGYGEYIQITTEGMFVYPIWVDLPAEGEFWRRFVWVLDGSGGMIGVLQIVEAVYTIFLIVLLSNFFRKYAPRHAIIFTLICCLVPIARYIFVFALRNKQAINYEDYLRRQREEFIRRQKQNGGFYGPYGPYSPYGQGGPMGGNGTAEKPPEAPFGEFGESPKSGGENKGESGGTSDGLFD